MKMIQTKVISETVAHIAEALSSAELHLVLEAALSLLRKSYLHDVAIVDGIDRHFNKGQRRDDELARTFAQMSEVADERYTELQDMGAKCSVYNVYFRLARAYYALGLIFDASELSHELLDNVIYEIGFSVEDIDTFQFQLEEAIRAMLCE